jgi:hypothetical protein
MRPQGHLEAQAEARHHPAVVVDQKSQPRLADGPGFRAHDYLQWAVIDFHSLKDSGGQLLSRSWRVAAVGDSSSRRANPSSHTGRSLSARGALAVDQASNLWADASTCGSDLQDDGNGGTCRQD